MCVTVCITETNSELGNFIPLLWKPTSSIIYKVTISFSSSSSERIQALNLRWHQLLYRGQSIIGLREKHFVIKFVMSYVLSRSDYTILLLSPFPDKLQVRSLSPSVIALPSSFSSFSESPFLTESLLWVLTCLARWSLRIKRLLQMGQANRFSPVCVRKCLCSSSERVNRFPQNNQLHTNGRSPVCQRRCALRCEVFPYTLPQPGMWQICWVFFLKGAPAALSLSLSWQFGQSQVARPV